MCRKHSKEENVHLDISYNPLQSNKHLISFTEGTAQCYSFECINVLYQKPGKEPGVNRSLPLLGLAALAWMKTGNKGFLLIHATLL